MKCNHPIEAPVCAFHFNGVCSREHNYECPALAKPRYIDANRLIDLATHEGAYGYVDVYDICHAAAVDVVEVVRCRDCEYWDSGSPLATVIPTPCRCRLRREAFGMTAEDFCSYGRRKTDETN